MELIDKSWLRPQWQEIDYSQSEAGNAPFDGNPILLKIQGPHFSQTSHAVVQSFWRVSCLDVATGWYASFHNTRISNEKATHWMPIPEFLKG